MISSGQIETQCWALIEFMSPYIWYVKASCAGVCAVLMFFQSWKVSKSVLALRYLTILGATLIAVSWGNTALGPLGDIIFWPSFAAYHTVLVWKLLPAIRAQAALQPQMPEIVAFNYMVRGSLPAPNRQRRAAQG